MNRLWFVLSVLIGAAPACSSVDDVDDGAPPLALDSQDEGLAKADRPAVPTYWMECRNAPGAASVRVDLLYRLRTIEWVDGDRHADVRGVYRAWLPGRGWSLGTFSGGQTPHAWYGGAFDVELSSASADWARFLVLRENHLIYLWINDPAENGEARELRCTGAVPF
jgi:hypothetical protein